MFFTSNQKKAHDFNRHISLSAGAGSGKTAVLVNRYLRILLETPTKVPNIVAITFTEKAATELKHRIARQIDNYLAKDFKQDRLEQIKSEIHQAQISTIHSFCSRLLREFPTESKVPVGFSVIEPFERRQMLSEAMHAEMSEIAEAPKSRQDHQDLTLLLRHFGRSKLETTLLHCFEKAETMNEIIKFYDDFPDDNQIIQRWQIAVDNEISSQINITKFVDYLEQLTHHATGKKAYQIKKIISALSSDIKDQLKQLRTLSQLILTQSNTIATRDFLGSAAKKKELSDLIDKVKTAAQVIKNLPSTNSADRFLLKIARPLLSLYKRIQFKYQRRKSQNSLLDFSDLQIHFCNLLRSNRKIQRQLQKRYQYIMIDEYQDTNQLQFEIVNLLLDKFQSGNLFIVGDPKQSIYGFRGADASVFNRTTEALAHFQKSLNRAFVWRDSQSIGQQELPATDQEKTGKISLADNFRLTRNLIGFVNLVFSHLMKEHPDMLYQPLVWGRDSVFEGQVEVLLGSDKRKTVDTEELDDNRLVARRIRHLVSAKTLVERSKKDDESCQPICYKDVAIIIRSRTRLPDIEIALQEEDIPYQITGGIGFYQRQEIYDLVNYLQFLENPTNSMALVGILRSPFFGLSDVDLFSISQVKNVEEFWNKLLVYETEIQPSNRLNHVLQILKTHLTICHQVPLPTLIRRIVNETAMIGILATGRQGNQKWANYQKLLQIAREFEKGENANLSNFLKRLNLLIEIEEREGQATIEHDLDRVQIMTVHAAKGLEFPVVFLPHLGRRFRPEIEPYLQAEYGIGFSVDYKDNRSQFYLENGLSPAILKLMKKQATDRMIAEEKRLFYVAATRARDRLILAGTPQDNSNSSSWMNWLFTALGLDQAPREPMAIWPVSVQRISDEDHQFDLPIHFTRHIDLEEIEIENSSESQLVELAQNEVNLEPVRKNRQEQFWTISRLATLVQCETKFYLQNQIVHSDLTDFSLGLVHHSTEMIDFDKKVHRALARLRTTADLEILRSQLPTNVWRHVETFAKSEIGYEVLLANNTELEMPIQAKIGRHIVSGIFDRLFQKTNGLWSLIDYKTDYVELFINGHIFLDRLSYYRAQMELQALCLHKLYPNQSAISTILFFTETGKVEVQTFSGLQLSELEKRWVQHLDQLNPSDLNRNYDHCPNCSYYVSQACLLSPAPSDRFPAQLP